MRSVFFWPSSFAKRLLADVCDQPAFACNEPEFVLQVAFEESLIDVPGIAEIDCEDPRQVGDMIETGDILRIGRADGG